jgi:hypothetical protein
LLERLHRVQGDASQLGDTLRVFIGLVKGAVGVQRLLDFFVAG